MWQQLQPQLELHEKLEDTLLYAPLATEMGPGTPLGDWLERHDSEVATVKELIAAVEAADGGTPRWRTAVGRVADALNHHVMGEEGQIFGRIEQVWDAERLESVGAQMQAAVKEATGQKAAVAGGKRR
jgi:hemerythrin-like domain-containing protein